MKEEIININLRLEKIEGSLYNIENSISSLRDTMQSFMVDFNETSTKAQSMAETIFNNNKDSQESEAYEGDLGDILNISSSLKDLKSRINNITKNL